VAIIAPPVRGPPAHRREEVNVARPSSARAHRYRSARPRRDRAAGAFTAAEGFIPGTRRDTQNVRPDWLPHQAPIEGVRIVEVRNVLKGNGHLTEIYRAEWNLDGAAVDQVFQVQLGPDEISAWHVHRDTRDRLFVNHGAIRIVLYDARRASPTHRRVNEYRFGSERPALLCVPAGVWHGIQNLRREPSLILNLVDRAYAYEAPDHWRLPLDSPRIPYRFPSPPARGG
jgi:dTDP-4-dehydrorhamnose 3,5-epimerase